MDNRTGRFWLWLEVMIQVHLLIVQPRKTIRFIFQTIVYLTALENGYTPIGKILDAPFVVDDYSDKGVWRPANMVTNFTVLVL